jgi:predicted outer membrane lipoprotein
VTVAGALTNRSRTSAASEANTAVLAAKARRAEAELKEARRALEREAASLERLRLEKRSEIHFELLRQRHHESRIIADRWYEHTRNARKIRRSASAGLTKLREKKRTLARRRDSLSRGHRSSVVSELQATQHIIDQLYGSLSSLDQEIERGRRGLTEYNRQTGALRDHIRDNCGVKGRLWYERLEARKRKSVGK